MKKLLTLLLVLLSLNALAYKYKNGDFFKNQVATGLATYTSIIEPYNEMSLDWKIVTPATTATGTMTLYGSNDPVTNTADIVRWYAIAKDVAAATIAMTVTTTGTTASGYVDLGRVNYRWIKLSFAADAGSSTTAANATISSSYMTKGW